MTVSPAISATDVKVVRGEKTILRGVSLEVKTGEVVGVLGPSGAGKSTLFRALVGELPVASGTIALAGRDVTKEPLWRRAQAGVAYVPQTPSVLWDLTVEENLRVYHRVVHARSFWAQRSRLAGEDDAIAKLAARVALEDRMNVRAGELSGGERRRLELARALTRRPKVLVCDEPFAAIDPQQATRLGDLLGGLGKGSGGDDPVAVVLADHHVAEALSVCTRALLLLDGRIAVEAPPDQFREDPLVQGRYLGSWQRSLPPPSP